MGIIRRLKNAKGQFNENFNTVTYTNSFATATIRYQHHILTVKTINTVTTVTTVTSVTMVTTVTTVTLSQLSLISLLSLIF